jgi:hypothetical protein
MVSGLRQRERSDDGGDRGNIVSHSTILRLGAWVSSGAALTGILGKIRYQE